MKKEDILANCIDEILTGRSTLEDCLDRYPQLADELRPLLGIASGIRPDEAVPTARSVERIKARVLRAMASSQVHRREGRIARAFGWFRLPVAMARMSLPALAGVVLAFLVVAGGSVAYASQGSLPGDVLYPVKKSVESVQIVLTFTPEAKAGLHARLAQRRVDEVIAQTDLGEDVSAATLAAIAAQIDAAVKEIDRVLPEDTRDLLGQLSALMLDKQLTLSQVLEESSEEGQEALAQALDALRRGNLVAQAAYGNPEILRVAPASSDEQLEASRFKLKGTLNSVDGETWNVGGVILDNVSSPETPPAGSRVKVKGLALGDRLFFSEIEVKGGPVDRLEIEGVFRGISSDGTVWNIGALSIGVPPGTPPPAQGEWVELKGVMEDGILVISDMETEEPEDAVEIEGLLVQVDGEEQTIIVEVAGRRIVIGAGDASITDDEGRRLALYRLEDFVGSYAHAEGLHTVDDLLVAERISLDVDIEDDEREDDERGDGEKRDRDDGGTKDADEDTPGDSGEDASGGEQDSPDEPDDDSDEDDD